MCLYSFTRSRWRL